MPLANVSINTQRRLVMAEIKEVHTYDTETSSSNAMVIIVVLFLAILTVALVVWQPWSTAPARDTTIITTPAADRGPDTTIINPPSTTIVNPPANPPDTKTEINIDNGSGGTGTGTGTTG